MQELITVKQIPVIEERLKSIRDSVEQRINDAMNTVCTEDTYKDVKKLRAELGKEYKELEERRKQVKAAVMEPYTKFEQTYKECIGSLYVEADKTLKIRIDEVETELKNAKKVQVEEFYRECVAAVGMQDYALPFDMTGIAVGMSSSVKSLKKEAKEVVDKLADDIKAISMMDDCDKILVEYKTCRSITNAISTVAARKARVQAEREARERAAQETVVEEPKEEAMEAPIVKEEPEIYELTFTVWADMEKLKALKKFLIDGGYKYE